MKNACLKRQQNEFWDMAATTKEFRDPFYLECLNPYIEQNSLIVEYGCGYGRILDKLNRHNYKNVIGFDFSKEMIKKGQQQFPFLNMNYIEHSNVPLKDKSVDVVILSTVLCCVPDISSQHEIITEMTRILKANGILYLTDFLITETDGMTKKYRQYSDKYEWGVYETSEGAMVKHHTEEYISNLLSKFKSLWYQKEDFITMNNNPVNTFHGIYKLQE